MPLRSGGNLTLAALTLRLSRLAIQPIVFHALVGLFFWLLLLGHRLLRLAPLLAGQPAKGALDAAPGLLGRVCNRAGGALNRPLGRAADRAGGALNRPLGRVGNRAGGALNRPLGRAADRA